MTARQQTVSLKFLQKGPMLFQTATWNNPDIQVNSNLLYIWLSMWRNILTSLAAVDELVASQWHPTNHQKKAGHISWTVLGQDQITARLRSPYSAGPVSHKRRLWPIGENIPSPSNAHSLLLKSLNLPKKLVYGGWKPFIR